MALVRVSRSLGLLIASTLLSTLAWAQSQQKPPSVDAPAPSAQDKTVATAPATSPSEYVGAQVCKTCHEDIYNNWEKSPHWKTTLDTKGGASHQGCEGGHGPGSPEVAGGGEKTKIFIFSEHSSKEINAQCLTCHAGGTQHMNAINSEHSKNNVSCTSCHSPHHPETKEFLLIQAQPALCYSCHLDKKAQFAMPFHHRVDEGLIQCSDCHNVHGTVSPKQVRSSSAQ